MDTTSLLTAALQLPDLWRVPGVEFRDGADVKRKLRITIGFAPDSRFHCPETGYQRGVVPGAWRAGQVLAASELLPAQSVHPRGRAARVTCPRHDIRAVTVP